MPPPEPTSATSAPMPPCSTPSITNGPRTYACGAPTRLHDFHLVAAGVEREPDDVGDRQRGGHRQHRAEDQADAANDIDRRQQARQPLPVVAHIGDAGHLTQLRREAVDAAARRRARTQPHFVSTRAADCRRAPSIAVARSPKVCLKRDSASAFDTYSRAATRSLGASAASIARRSSAADVVLEIDRQLGRVAPFVAEPLEIRGHGRKAAEHEQRQRDRRVDSAPACRPRHRLAAASSNAYRSARIRRPPTMRP